MRKSKQNFDRNACVYGNAKSYVVTTQVVLQMGFNFQTTGATEFLHIYNMYKHVSVALTVARATLVYVQYLPGHLIERHIIFSDTKNEVCNWESVQNTKSHIKHVHQI